MGNLKKPITTDEELNAAIKDEIEKAAKKYEGWASPEELGKLKDAIEESEKKIAEKDRLIEEGAGYKTSLEKLRIALAAGLPEKYAERLVGKDAAAWKADAAELAKDFAAAQRSAPLGSSEPADAGTGQYASAAAFKSMAESLTNN